tara:strand:+ start:177 stop:674 length:498 start_codon:yes stop_codon:yes gene_type:complete
MKLKKILVFIFLLAISNPSSIVYAETIKFAASTYEGEVKKGKAHGIGIFTFSDGSTYQGKVSKNRIHGKGKYTDSKGNIFEGKFKYGKLITKIDSKTRSVVKIKPKTGYETYTEIKGSGNASSSWFEAEKNSSGKYELTAKGQKDLAAANSGASSEGSSSGSSGC